jgi:ribonuclease VapC
VIVDTSAVVAVAREEGTSQHLKRILLSHRDSLMSAASYVELTIVLWPDHSIPMVDRLLDALDVTPVPVTVDQARLAAQAYREYGKGSGSPARLNLGDTFSYALAKDTGQPLLFVGDDFTHTDITSALPA